MDPNDLDGIFDIARYGLESMINQAPTRTLLNNLIYRIATMALGKEIPLQPYDPSQCDLQPHDFDDDDPNGDNQPIGDGTIILTVTPMPVMRGPETY